MELCIYLKEQEIIATNGITLEQILNFKEYSDVIESIDNNKHSFLKKTYNEYKIMEKEIIKEKFITIFNFILMNNLANYLYDKIDVKKDFILFEDHIDYIDEKTIKLTSVLTISEIYNNIINILINYNKVIKERIKIKSKKDYTKDLKIKYNSLEEIFYYMPKEKEKILKKLEEDLIAFNFITKKEKNEKGRYVLPIYLDKEKLKQKGIENVENFIKNWESIAYLKMIEKIHDYFITYYKLDLDKGLKNDVLTSALFDIFDTEIKDSPKGLQRSIEIGRETAGKCFFIDKVITPIPLSIDLALILQGKDIYSVVVRASKNN